MNPYLNINLGQFPRTSLYRMCILKSSWPETEPESAKAPWMQLRVKDIEWNQIKPNPCCVKAWIEFYINDEPMNVRFQFGKYIFNASGTIQFEENVRLYGLALSGVDEAVLWSKQFSGGESPKLIAEEYWRKQFLVTGIFCDTKLIPDNVLWRTLLFNSKVEHDPVQSFLINDPSYLSLPLTGLRTSAKFNLKNLKEITSTPKKLVVRDFEFGYGYMGNQLLIASPLLENKVFKNAVDVVHAVSDVYLKPISKKPLTDDEKRKLEVDIQRLFC